MKLLLLAVAVFALAHGKSLNIRGIDKDDGWFKPLRDLGTAIIVETFDLEDVRGLVKETVEGCMQEDDVTDCMEKEVDTVSDAVGDVSKEDREDAKVKVAALADFLGAVYGECKDKPEEEIGKCAFGVGKYMCENSDFDMKECMKGVMYVLGKAKELHDKAEGKKGGKKGGKKDKKGIEKDDDWFQPLKELGTEIITETFGLDGVKDKVGASVEKCMQEDDTTACMEKEVDTVSDALGQDVSKADRDDAKVKVAALSDFLGAVYGECKDKPDEEIGKCAWGVGKYMCENSDFDMKECMKGVMYVLGKAKELHDKAEGKKGGKKGGKKDRRGIEKDDEWFQPLKELGTEIITEHFGLDGVKDKVGASVEKCMQEDDTTACMEKEVDTVSDALGQDVSKADRNDAKVKVAALSDFLGAVYGECKDVPEDKIGECAWGVGKYMCDNSDFDNKECMKGVMYVLLKAKELHDKKGGKKGGKKDKKGLDKSDDWFEPLRDLGTEIITETFGLDGVKDKVKAAVEGCMQEDDTTACMEKEVDTVSDALGQDVSKADRDDAKVKVAALSDFLGAVYGKCRDVPEDQIGKCAWGTGKAFCAKSDFDKKDCMKGVMYVLGKAKEMAEKSDK